MVCTSLPSPLAASLTTRPRSIYISVSLYYLCPHVQVYHQLYCIQHAHRLGPSLRVGHCSVCAKYLK